MLSRDKKHEGEWWHWVNDLKITIDGEEVPVDKIHDIGVASQGGNIFKGRITYLKEKKERGGRRTSLLIEPDENVKELVPKQTDKGVTHTESLFKEYAEKKLSDPKLDKETLKAIIFDIRQTNTPCSSCTRVLEEFVTNTRKAFPKAKVILRASARKFYESSMTPAHAKWVRSKVSKQLWDKRIKTGDVKVFNSEHAFVHKNVQGS